MMKMFIVAVILCSFQNIAAVRVTLGADAPPRDSEINTDLAGIDTEMGLEKQMSTDDTLALLTLNKNLVQRSDKSVTSAAVEGAVELGRACATPKCNTKVCQGSVQDNRENILNYDIHTKRGSKKLAASKSIMAAWEGHNKEEAQYCKETYSPGNLECERLREKKLIPPKNPGRYTPEEVCRSCRCKKKDSQPAMYERLDEFLKLVWNVCCVAGSEECTARSGNPPSIYDLYNSGKADPEMLSYNEEIHLPGEDMGRLSTAAAEAGLNSEMSRPWRFFERTDPLTDRHRIYFNFARYEDGVACSLHLMQAFQQFNFLQKFKVAFVTQDYGGKRLDNIVAYLSEATDHQQQELGRYVSDACKLFSKVPAIMKQEGDLGFADEPDAEEAALKKLAEHYGTTGQYNKGLSFGSTYAFILKPIADWCRVEQCSIHDFKVAVAENLKTVYKIDPDLPSKLPRRNS